MKYTDNEMEQKAILNIASMMMAAAKTAPKARGVNAMVSMVIDGDDKDAIANKMREMGKEFNFPSFIRDANNLDSASCVVLLGAVNKPQGLNPCSFCGFANCAEAKKAGALCSFSVGDLGIAVGSAVSIASLHHVDNRIMYTIGKAVLSLGLFDEDVKIVYGIPLSVSAKSPFHDRK